MDRQNILRKTHLVGMTWFFVCAGYILGWGMVRAGSGRLVAVSVSGYSAGLLFLAICFYLFAVLHRLGAHPQHHLEHPFTSTFCYGLCYNMSPIMGGAVAVLAAVGTTGMWDYLLAAAVGSFSVTLAVWMILDPLAVLGEMLLPSSRQHRAARLARAKEDRRQEALARERALVEAEAAEAEQLRVWEEVLGARAAELAKLSIASAAELEGNRGRIVDTGITAWQLGGIGCMRHLYSMAQKAAGSDGGKAQSMEFVSYCWEGIGSWYRR